MAAFLMFLVIDNNNRRMNNMKQYIVDAFTDTLFGGNPAAVCIMEEWLDDDLMMRITKENNLSETAFAVKEKDGYQLRWFTPGGEIDLCGHATLACAFIIMKFYEPSCEQVVFHTLSGNLTVVKKGNLYEMEFPAYELKQVEVSDAMITALGETPIEAYMGRDLLCIFDDANVIRKLQPNLEKVKELDGLLLQVSAPGEQVDCISRSFAPKLQVAEDPVCGSGHCHIIPYWSRKLKKEDLIAYQASKRGGTLFCRMAGDKVFLAGQAVLYAEAEINIGK